MCLAPNVFRRRAVAHMAAYRDSTESLTFPYRQNTILRVQLSVKHSDGSIATGLHQAAPLISVNVEDSVTVAQREVIEQEIFTLLVQESSALPTASAKVSERLIVIEAAQSTELKFELVSNG
jgi:mediator of RNA polymerase II transcription subunit 17, fungi type